MRPSVIFDHPAIRSVLDFVFPPLCLGCGEFYESEPAGPNQPGEPVCERCRAQIEALSFQTVVCAGCGAVLSASGRCPECGEGFWPLFAFGNYRAPLKDVILEFKFKGITSPASWVAPRLAARFESEFKSLGQITLAPIPLHPTREYYRGYNQAGVFAAALGRELGMPVVADLLARKRRRRPQSRVDHRQRDRNVKGVFEVTEEGRETADIVLVDDVVTTGATIREARRTLQAAGYRVAAAAAIAHGV